MPKKQHLYPLIKSLNKSEKRYFKLFCLNQSERAHYLDVFEAIDRQQEWNESLLKWKFRAHKFVRQFHVIKHYLFHLLLKSLRNYYTDQSKYAQALDGLRNVEILYQKALLDACQHEINRVRKITETYELDTLTLELLNWERRILLQQGKNPTTAMNALMTSEQQIIQKMQRTHDLWELTFNIFQFRGNQDDGFEQKPCLIFPERESLKNDVQRAHLQYTHQTMNGQAQKGLQILEKLIEELEAHPHRIRETPGNYATALNNLISAYLFAGRHKEVWPLLDKVKAIPTRYKLKTKSPFSIRLQLRTYNIELELLRDGQQWTAGKKLVEEVSRFLERHRENIADSYQLLLPYQFAYILFKNKDYGEALRWCNELINRPVMPERADIQVYARFLNLMIHFEMDNVFVLKYAVESSRRFFRKESVKKQAPAFAAVLFRFFSRISNTPRAEYPEKFEQLKLELFAPTAPKMKAHELDYLDLKSWIEGQLV